MAAIADLSNEDKARAKNFGLLGAIGGLSFISAIILSGSLTINPSFPFWIAVILSFANLGYMLLFFKESHPVTRMEKFHPLQGIYYIISAFAIPNLRIVYLIFFLFMACWVTSMQFLPTYLFFHYEITQKLLVYTFVGIGLSWSTCNLLINRFLARHFPPHKTLLITLFLLAAALLTFIFSYSLIYFLIVFFLATCCSSLCWTNCLATLSLRASQEIQGRILGINQSMGALAAIIGPSLGGMIAGIDIHWLYLFTGFTCLSAALIFYRSCKKENS